jgi:tetratricopeptide (TPR) repeat protein
VRGIGFVLLLWAGVARAGSFDLAGWRAHIATLEAQAEANPRDAATPLRLAGGFAARGLPDDALKWAAVAEARGANPLQVRLVRGDACLQAGRLEDAVREYFEVVDAAPDNAYAHVQLWRALSQADPAKLPAALDLARVRAVLVQGGYHLPTKVTRPARTAEAEADARRGFESVRAGRFQEALERFDAALSQDVAFAEAHRGIGIALAALDRPAAALGAYRLYLALTPRETQETRRLKRLVDDAERRRGLDFAGAR